MRLNKVFYNKNSSDSFLRKTAASDVFVYSAVCDGRRCVSAAPLWEEHQ